MLDDTPVIPGDARPAYDTATQAQARQVLNDVEDDLRDWRPDSESFDVAPSYTKGEKDEIDNAKEESTKQIEEKADA